MNIFVLDQSPYLAAQYACDMHVSKMVTETAQILCTVHRNYPEELPELEELLKDPNFNSGDRYEIRRREWDKKLDNEGFYRKTHSNHPCCVWVSSRLTNYEWTYRYFLALAEEYTFRFGKQHAAFLRTGRILEKTPRILDTRPDTEATPPPLVVSSELLTEIAGSYAYDIMTSCIEQTSREFRLSNPNRYTSVNPRFLNWDLCVKYYRKYYYTDKLHIARWTKREVPYWFEAELKKQGYVNATKTVKVRVETTQVSRTVNIMDREIRT